MTKKATILGCGLVGATMARELAADDRFEVVAVDASPENLARLNGLERISTRAADLSESKQLCEVIADADVVLGALPSRFGLQTLEGVIRAGKPYCDISFMPEDALTLDALAKRHRVAAVVDCGVSPGLSNMMIGFAHAQLDRADHAEIFVGGLPRERRWPFQYKAPFAPSDVIEEYVRPARMREAGRLVIKPALSEPELVDIPGIGTLEAFNTDGLRSLLTTVDIPSLKEKTLRYPGHIELMRVLRDTGFFDSELIDIRGVHVRPLDLTAKLLFPKWKLDDDEREFTYLRVDVAGDKGGRSVRHRFELFDEFDPMRRMSSMARTTGFPCVIVATLLADGRLPEPGVHPPEIIAKHPGVFEHVVSELGRRGVRVTHAVEE